MNKTLKKILEQLSRDQLISVIEQAHGSNKTAQAIIEQAIAAYNPKEQYKLTNKTIAAIKRGTRFISYRESYEFSEKLDRINHGIAQLVTQAPELAIQLCQRFISIDQSICKRMDDSGGFVSTCYATTYSLLDRAFMAAQTNVEDIGNYLYDIYSQDDYGLRGEIINNSQQSLRAGADQVLETLLREGSLNHYAQYAALKIIADIRDDVDAYIELSKQDEQHLERPLSDISRCEIAKRLNAASRSEEAINWLNTIQDDSNYYSEKTKLLIEAYHINNQGSKVQHLHWQRFERYLQTEDYAAYLQQTAETERETVQAKAIEVAKTYERLRNTFRFLTDIQQWDEVEYLIIQHAKADTLNGADYTAYRKLSTTLAQQGKGLAATLLRRVLIEHILNQAQSKYYQYAASDLKKAHDYAQTVTDWQGFLTHPAFMQALQTQHARKHAFWSRVEPLE